MASASRAWLFRPVNRRVGDASPVICHCLGVTERQLARAVFEGHAQSLEELIQSTQAGTGCTACRLRLKALLRELLSSANTPAPAACDGACEDCPRRSA